jgi:hypothetical protein
MARPIGGSKHGRRRKGSRSVRLARAIDDLDPVPYLDAGVNATGEQLLGPSLGVYVVVAVKHLGCRDTISGIQVVEAIDGHGRTGTARGITPTSGAFTQAHGVAEVRRAFVCGKSIEGPP